MANTNLSQTIDITNEAAVYDANSDTIQRVMKAYSFEEPEAKEYVDRFWK